jgi:hypothetical protein
MRYNLIESSSMHRICQNGHVRKRSLMHYYFFTMRRRGAILARLLSPTRYEAFPLLPGERLAGLIVCSGVRAGTSGDVSFDKLLGTGGRLWAILERDFSDEREATEAGRLDSIVSRAPSSSFPCFSSVSGNDFSSRQTNIRYLLRAASTLFLLCCLLRYSRYFKS